MRPGLNSQKRLVFTNLCLGVVPLQARRRPLLEVLQSLVRAIDVGWWSHRESDPATGANAGNALQAVTLELYCKGRITYGGHLRRMPVVDFCKVQVVNCSRASSLWGRPNFSASLLPLCHWMVCLV